MVTRRRLLAEGVKAAAAGLALAALPKLAAALSLEPMGADATRLMANRCSSDPMHDEILRELEARLDGRALSDAEKTLVRRQLSADCPLCGCRLSLAQE